jgi:hypothetical protein
MVPVKIYIWLNLAISGKEYKIGKNGDQEEKTDLPSFTFLD